MSEKAMIYRGRKRITAKIKINKKLRAKKETKIMEKRHEQK